MRPRYLIGIVSCLLICALAIPGRVWAAPGTPATLEFGYGARINSDGPYVAASIRLAARMQVDWVALDFDWAVIQPEPGQWNEDNSFSWAILLARSLGLEALVSVKNAPAWAMTAPGPAGNATAALAVSLADKYSNLRALELFPEANTRAGWGAAPDAVAYAGMFNTVQAQINAEELGLYLVAGGLSNTLAAPEDVRDLDFLQQLYSAGLRPEIVGMRLHDLTGQPLETPSATSLRHYEELRALMVANGHTDGLLWLTSFSMPESLSGEWLAQAYGLMHAQLYLGAAFYGQFNSSAAGSLVGADGTLQPACFSLQAVINAKKGSQVKLGATVETGLVNLMVRK